MNSHCETSDLLVFSHLRWDSIFQRPQHLLSRHAKYRRVFYFEEPVLGMTDMPRLHLRETSENVLVVIPYLPANMEAHEINGALKDLVDELIYEEELTAFTIWYYTPRALTFSKHLEPQAIIYDRTKEFSEYELEAELMKKSDIIFTSGQFIFEASKKHHHNVHAFPSSIDFKHFSQSRLDLVEPHDQIQIPHPRLGFYGVIDESFNTNLLAEMADLRPDFQFILLGPVLKINVETLPKRNNIHYLGKKDYHALPLYFAGWDCVILPYALNEATRFLSPTNTSEFLAAGKPVVSSAIQDVISPYGDEKLAYIAQTAEEFIACTERAMKADQGWIEKVDKFLAHTSWDLTFRKMALIEKELPKKRIRIESRIHHITPITLTASGMV